MSIPLAVEGPEVPPPMRIARWTVVALVALGAGCGLIEVFTGLDGKDSADAPVTFTFLEQRAEVR